MHPFILDMLAKERVRDIRARAIRRWRAALLADAQTFKTVPHGLRWRRGSRRPR